MKNVLAIDFGGTKVAVGIVTPGGEILQIQKFAIAPGAVANEVLARAVVIARELLDDQSNGSIVGVGVSSPGIIGEDNIQLAPNVAGWGNLMLRRQLGDALRLPVVATNDVRAATTAELRWGVLHGVANGLHVNLGTGLSMGIVLDGRIRSGAHDAAGEIGYLLLEPIVEMPSGSRAAPLEERLGGRGLGQRAGDLMGRPMTAADLFAAAGTNADIAAFLADELDDLAMHLANLAIVLDPEVVSLGGGLMRSAARILPVIDAAMRSAAPFPPIVRVAAFSDDGPLVGAAAVAFDALVSEVR